MRFTDLSIRSLEPPEKGQKLYADDTLSAFYLRVSQGGTKSFLLVHGRDRQFTTIGRYPNISLAQARAEAKRLLAEITLGKTRPKSLSYQQAVELFLADRAKGIRPRTLADYTRHLKLLNFKGPVVEISPHDASRKLDRFTSPSERGHILVSAKTFFKWCVERRHINDNPFMGLSKPAMTSRNRVLTEGELKAVWKATAVPTPFNSIIRLCITTGQRRGELAQIHPTFIEGDRLTIPAHIAKNGREHSIPLSDLSLQVLKTFPYRDRPFNNWSDAKATLDKASGTKGWVIHDVRRTFASRLAQLGTPIHITEKLLNHISGSHGGIVGVYQRYSFWPEQVEALSHYTAYLKQLFKTA